ARSTGPHMSQGSITMKRWTEPRYEPMTKEGTDRVREAPFTFRRTVGTLARPGLLLCAAPAGIALALGASTGACSSSDPSTPLPPPGVQAVRGSLGDGDAPRDGDIVTITGTRSRSGWNSAERMLSPSSVAQEGLTKQWQSPVLDSFTVTNADGTTTTYPP